MGRRPYRDWKGFAQAPHHSCNLANKGTHLRDAYKLCNIYILQRLSIIQSHCTGIEVSSLALHACMSWWP